MLRKMLLLLLAVLPLQAYDVVYTKKKEKIEGTIIQENDQEVRISPYFTGFEKVTYEVRTIPRNEVLKIEKVEDKLQVAWARMAALAADDVAGRLELAKWCAENKLDVEKVAMVASILAVQADHAEARALLSEKELKALEKDDPRIHLALGERIRAYLAIPDRGSRKAEYAAMKKDLGVKEPDVYFERMARSAPQPKGLREDIKLTLLSNKQSGVYTVFVPERYDPTRPWPLVVGLHGGGADGADGKGVIGSGKEFMGFIQGQCEKHGFIAVCPTARAAPWRAAENDAWFLTVIREVQMLYNVDLNRVYLIGHSMGGFGTWHFGPLYCEQFAVIAPASGGGNNSHKKLATCHTAVYVYHSDDDPRCSVDDSRDAARTLKKTVGSDFIYTELPGRQHDFPAEVIQDMFALFEARRLWVPAGAKNARPGREPRSSFLEKLTPEEQVAFPFPDEADDSAPGKAEIRKLIEDLVRGGGGGEKAAQRLGELKDPSSVAALGKVLTTPDLASDDARGYAAWALGEIGNASGSRFLLAGLKDKAQVVRARSFEALGKLADAKSVPYVIQGLKDLAKRFEEKTQGKSTMDLTDWEALMTDLAIYARATARFKDARTVPEMHQTLVKKMILAGVEVVYDKIGDAGPARTRRLAAEALIEAFEAIGDPKGAAALKELAAGLPEDADQAEKARLAAEKLEP